MKTTLAAVARKITAQLVGDGGVEVENVASIASAKSGDLVFAEDEATLAKALDSGATAVIAGEFAATDKAPKPLLIVPFPKLAFALAARVLCPPRSFEPGIHSSAVIEDSARLGRHVAIEPGVVIGEKAIIGDRSRIGAGSVIGPEVRMGSECNIAPNVTIYAGVRLGSRVIVHSGAVLGSDGFGYMRNSATGRYEKFPQIGGLEIGDDVEIGANTTVDRGALDLTIIGRGAKLDNLVHVGHNVRIGEDVVIAAQTGFSGSITVENGAVIGGQVGIGDHARIEQGVILGSQCGVLPKKTVRGPGVVFWGTPARPLRQYLKELAVLARLGRKSST
ncbi:MAG TPA: UDP-3-O-(3-hydroxymyristoyl)glucosamine N-acyltransferase [Terriglobales bacterium]|nr:UDP-3-O-(3-hydroxymyristoyl)glucosamine N-acyltransferase [Terriglobales bacterium]